MPGNRVKIGVFQNPYGFETLRASQKNYRLVFLRFCIFAPSDFPTVQGNNKSFSEISRGQMSRKDLLFPCTMGKSDDTKIQNLNNPLVEVVSTSRQCSQFSRTLLNFDFYPSSHSVFIFHIIFKILVCWGGRRNTQWGPCDKRLYLSLCHLQEKTSCNWFTRLHPRSRGGPKGFAFGHLFLNVFTSFLAVLPKSCSKKGLKADIFAKISTFWFFWAKLLERK